MYWRLNDGLSLRSWRDFPRALLRASDGEAIAVGESDFGLLKCCDGETPLPDGERLRAFEANGWVTPFEEATPVGIGQRLTVYDVAQFSSANIAVTGFCNYNCKHCFMAKDSGAPRSAFTLEQLEQILDDCVKCGITRISLTGGEPLVRSDFPELLKAITKRGLKIANITTNGSMITDDLIALMRELNQKPLMRVSFDGVGWHDWMRGVPGAEQVATDAIRRLRQEGFSVLAQMCVHTGNLSSMRETAEFLAGLGVKDLRIMRTGESPRWRERSGGAALTFEEYYDAALDFMRWYVGSGLNMDVDIWSFSRYSPSTGKFHCLPVRCPTGTCDMDNPLCYDARRELFIGYDGEMSPCSQISGKFGVMGISLGNVLKTGLASQLRESPYLDFVRTPISALTEASDECRNCEYLRYCLGGCRAMACVMTDHYLAPDPMSCVFFKKGYWRRLYDTMKENRPKVAAT
ncbi:MAG: radical SAM protein [Eubacteriales bacterium]|nr:radical SAM protein [Eubacteriales bacterium]